MRLLVGLVLVVALAAVVWLKAEPFAPTAALEAPVTVIGRATPVHVVAHDRGSGLAHVDVSLVAADGTAAMVASESWPAAGWFGSGVHEARLAPTIDAAAARLPAGPARLEVRVSDHSWLSLVRRPTTFVQPVEIDLTPPTIEVPPQEHVARQGGSECLVYRVGPDAAESGVVVGDTTFPGDVGPFTDPALRVALFAIPEDAPDAAPAVFATDAAGNRRTLPAGVRVRPRRFREDTLTIGDDFLTRKVPALLAANGLDPGGDLVEGYLRINRDLRATTEAHVRELCRESLPTPLWHGAFVRLPNAAPLAGFGDRRTYVRDGKVIDHQTHLGLDLASLKGATVPAGNTGVVVFAGPLGIYGNAVILDHGLGLFSLYGHLSEISVAEHARVERGAPIGRTGDTGLAGGDHLHFSVMIHGVHVDPIEWFDDHWIRDHVERRLAEFTGGRPEGAS
jgi:murein DD-endopeptidase MepM/ murein hydrolase activator NlpD